MDYRKLSDFEINLQVNRALGMKHYPNEEKQIVEVFGDVVIFDPCNNAADAWPIIAEHGIGIIPYKKGLAEAWNAADGLMRGTTKDANPLRAAMIVFLKMKESTNVQDNPAQHLLR